MGEDKIDFDALAAEWDEHATRLALSKAIGEAMRSCVDLDRSWQALEIGCGTGTLALSLARDLGEILATDSSSGMVVQLREKLAGSGICNISAAQLDLLNADRLGENYDLVYSAMAFHHIENVAGILTGIRCHLKTDGRLLLADLWEEDGSFHGQNVDIPRKGFSEKAMRNLLEESGFRLHTMETVHTIRKRESSYPVFLVHATPA